MLTDEQIRALLAGCEGVTKGPWAQDQFELQEVREGLGKRNAVAFCRQSSNAAHIARCDPQTIAELCNRVLVAEARVKVLEDALWEIADETEEELVDARTWASRRARSALGFGITGERVT